MNRFLRLFICAMVVALLGAPALTLAAPNTLPPRPPRDEGGDRGDSGNDGAAAIALHLSAADGTQMSGATLSGLWTVVQWVDGLGSWHDVDGWEGIPIAAAGNSANIAWNVDSSLFGRGPFRWIVEQSRGGTVVGASASFYLPHDYGEVVSVAVTTGSAASDDSRQPIVVPSPAIVLTYRANTGASNLWTMVQWGDGLGTWYDIARWQGPFDSMTDITATKTWAIEPILLGRGIFRWQVMQGKGGPLIATSEIFDLPLTARDIVNVQVSGQ